VLKVMIAEDDLIIADMIEEALTSADYEVCGIARTVTEAVALGRVHCPDLAIIDMQLANGGFGTQIVAELHGGPRIGVLYSTGNIYEVIALADGDACISKPYAIRDLVFALKIVTEIVGNGFAPRPFPPGFYLLNATMPSPWGIGYE
jgi:DNA-binding response OmpR family regulator